MMQDGGGGGGPMLDYRDRGAEPGVSRGQVVGGAVLAFVVVFAAVFIGIIWTIGPRGQAGSMVPLVVCAGIATVGLNAWAFAAYRDRKWRGYAIGLWIGFGLAALTEGLCFGVGHL